MLGSDGPGEEGMLSVAADGIPNVDMGGVGTGWGRPSVSRSMPRLATSLTMSCRALLMTAERSVDPAEHKSPTG